MVLHDLMVSIAGILYITLMLYEHYLVSYHWQLDFVQQLVEDDIKESTKPPHH